MPITDSVGSEPATTSVNTSVLQLGPGMFRIVCVTKDGNFLGDMTITTVGRPAIPALASAFNEFAARITSTIVPASIVPPIVKP